MPTLFVVSGPNGAGKSTYGNSFISTLIKNTSFFNGDKVRTRLLRQNPSILKGDLDNLVQIKYYRQRDFALENNKSFAYETNLSSSWLASDLAEMKFFKYKDYKTVLIFYDTITLQDSIERVILRVAEDGHNVERQTLIRNFKISAINFQKAYKQFDEAYLFINDWENNSSYPKLILEWRSQKENIATELLTPEIKSRFSDIFNS